jgi:hypothetical protein
MLAQALSGIDRPLPRCQQVVNAASSAAAFAAAAAVRTEVEAAPGELRISV